MAIVQVGHPNSLWG